MFFFKTIFDATSSYEFHLSTAVCKAEFSYIFVKCFLYIILVSFFPFVFQFSFLLPHVFCYIPWLLSLHISLNIPFFISACFLFLIISSIRFKLLNVPCCNLIHIVQLVKLFKIFLCYPFNAFILLVLSLIISFFMSSSFLPIIISDLFMSTVFLSSFEFCLITSLATFLMYTFPDSCQYFTIPQFVFFL